MEEIKELIKLPFDILNATTSKDQAMGYGILMILGAIAFLTLAYQVLEFLRKTIRSILEFIGSGFNNFWAIFKQKQPPKSVDNKVELDFETYTALRSIGESLEKLANRKDNVFDDI